MFCLRFRSSGDSVGGAPDAAVDVVAADAAAAAEDAAALLLVAITEATCALI